MLNIIDKEYLTFDDVMMLPQTSDISSRSLVDVSTKVGPLELNNPIISANMDTITGPVMLEAMQKAGGWGYLHRFVDETTRKQWACTRRRPVTVGVGEGEREFLRQIMDFDISHFLIDIAHGDSRQTMDMIKFIRYDWPDAIICAGNVATANAALMLAETGADIIKVGVGPGSVCITRSVTGHGAPQLTAIADVAEALRPLNVGIIADGGIRTSGDIVKALAAGADAVMIGGLFAGCVETPGENIITPSGNFKVYRGMASKEAYADNPNRKSKHPTAEGINTMVPSNGPAQEVVSRLVGGIQSGLTYSGVANLTALREKAQFIRVTPTTLIESGVRL